MCKTFSALLLTILVALCIAEALPQWQNRDGFHTTLRTWNRRPYFSVGDQQPRRDQPCNGHPMGGYPAADFRPINALVLPTEVEDSNLGNQAAIYGPPPTPMSTYGVPINSYEATAQNVENYEEEEKVTFKRDLNVDMENVDDQKPAEETTVQETLQQQSFDSDDSDVAVNNDSAQLQQQQEESQQQQLEQFEIPLAYLQIPVQFVPIARKQ